MSNIRFQAYRSESTFLDPRKGFEPTSTGFEVRVDPLTGRSGHLSHFGAIKAQKLPLDAYATPEVKGFCPFCPSKRESHTPKFAVKFLGAERPARNEAVLIPNLFPYDIYNGVLIMTDSHVVPLEGMTEGRLRDAFSLGIDFLREIKERDPSLPYHLMTWNYMPPSGGRPRPSPPAVFRVPPPGEPVHGRASGHRRGFWKSMGRITGTSLWKKSGGSASGIWGNAAPPTG